jgi:serine/threonine protein phosphatase PrpC
MRLPRPWARPDGAAHGLDVGWASAVGGRPDNQDRCAVGPGWAVVSDGIGGHPGGRRAADVAVTAASAALRDAGAASSEAVLDAVARANDAVRRARDQEPELAGMGATVTAAMGAGDRWFVANLGDSPAWLVRSDDAELLTEIHNLAGEMVRRGELDLSEADSHPGSRVLLRGAGLEEVALPALREVTVAPGDRLVLASDGLAGGIGEEEMRATVVPGGRSAAVDARRLVDAAVAGGSTDNVTAVVIRISR